MTPGAHLEVYPDLDFSATVIAPATTLDAWFERAPIDRIDLLWLDLQGLELEVLRGGTEALRSVAVCHLEVQREPLYEGSPVHADIRAFMGAHGFKEVARRVSVVSGNAIYVRDHIE